MSVKSKVTITCYDVKFPERKLFTHPNNFSKCNCSEKFRHLTSLILGTSSGTLMNAPVAMLTSLQVPVVCCGKERLTGKKRKQLLLMST